MSPVKKTAQNKSVAPPDYKPMLATQVDQPFDDPDWLYEIKWDGYRAMSYVRKGQVKMLSRNNLSFDSKFPGIHRALEAWKVNAVVDGEIVAMNEKGASDFQLLQGTWKKGGDADLFYYIFDLLWLDGKDLTGLPLARRKEMLKKLIPKGKGVLRYSDDVRGKGNAFFKKALSLGLEGVMAKKTDSTYQPGIRTGNWLKIKNTQQLEAIICGYTKGRQSRKYFGAIILGMYKGKELHYIGHSGSGFDDTELRSMYVRFQTLLTPVCPFAVIPKTNSPVTWLRPSLVCQIKFTEWTDEGLLRHPIYIGLRKDKKAANEKNTIMVKPPVKTKKPANTKTGSTKPVSTKSKPGGVLLPEEGAEDRSVKIDSQTLTFTHLSKVYWPKEGYTKRDLLNYYDRISPYILPYLKDRPQSLNRHPNGIGKSNFYQKNVKDKVAEWITTYRFNSESEGPIDFLVCTGKASLLYMANLGCIEMNPWHSRTQSADKPDWCVIDLDPDGNAFDQVIQTALVIKKILDGWKIDSYCKTSGKTGLHIYIPLGAKYSYDQSRMLARVIVDAAHAELPSLTSLERAPAKRKKKIYLDFLQNRAIQTLAAPYSLRPTPGAQVSTPLHWEELKKGLKPGDFTIENIFDRLEKEGDIFKPVLGRGINLEKILKNI